MNFFEKLRKLLADAKTVKDVLDGLKTMMGDAKDDKDVQAYLAEVAKPTTEGVTAFLETDEGRKLLQPRLDAHFTKGLKTWQEKSMPEVLEAEIKKRYPGETPEQKEIRELKVKQLESEKKAARADLRSKALAQMTAKGLPVDLVDNFIGDDETATNENLVRLEKTWTTQLQAAVDVKFKENGRDVNKGSGLAGEKGLGEALGAHYNK